MDYGLRMCNNVGMNTEQINYMVNRFLSWKLPENFTPDCGISFAKEHSIGTPYQSKYEPVGTNLFDAQQTKDMIEYITKELPESK